ncbi:Uu.00g126220.m01.CDS01 [Anthostomella pinea]|uniref:Uu.00g126220.m01.CDS01 n=1 Tax=Anthostomella pinea TaxID=933095 RepID=A0AAI8VHU6_9PEZI|nr:Uu.00g126220.m01.CDS01 [Anthostomella pinea]
MDSDHSQVPSPTSQRPSPDKPESSSSSPPPDGGPKAWSSVLGAWCCLFCSYGWINCIGIFENQYQQNQLRDYPPSTVAWITSVETFVMYASMPMQGKLYDTYGPVPLVFGGSLVHVFGLMMASLGTQYYQILLAQSICSALGAAAVFSAAVGPVGSWFMKRRALAFGIVASGSSLGAVILPIMITRLGPQIGFPWAMRICAFVFLFLLCIACLTLRSRNPPKPTPWSLMAFIKPLRERAFIFNATGLAFFSGGMFIAFNFLVLEAQHRGMGADLANYQIAILNGVSVFGRIIPGYLGDKLGRFNVMILTTFLSALLVFALWIPAPDGSTGATIAFSSLFGFTSGTFVGMTPALVQQISLNEEMGVRLGTTFGVISIMTLITNPIAGALITRDDGGYLYLKIFCGLSMMTRGKKLRQVAIPETLEQKSRVKLFSNWASVEDSWTDVPQYSYCKAPDQAPASTAMRTPESSDKAFKPAQIDLYGPEHGDNIRTIPELIQYNAEVNPDALFCLQALKPSSPVVGDDRTNGQSQTTVTMRELRDAIWRCSQRLKREFANPQSDGGDGGETMRDAPVALFMDSDLDLLIHLFSLMSLGIPVALLSARLSPVAVEHLLGSIHAQAIITSARLIHIVDRGKEAEKAAAVKILIGASFQNDLGTAEVISPPAGINICAPGHYVGPKDRNVLILHSSGTTGLPKAIRQPHKYLVGFAKCHAPNEIEDIGALNMSTLPLYHGFGLLVPCLALGVGKPFWVPPPHVVPTGLSTATALKQTGARSLMTVSHILDEICELDRDQGILSLTPLQFVACGGGPLKLETAEKLAAAGVKLVAHFGTTETGPLAPLFAPTPDDDWRYWRLRTDIRVHVDTVGKEFSADGTELTIHQLTMTPFGWETPFVLQDRLITSQRRPGKEFKAIGRTDDLVVLATGEKVQPRILEAALEENPMVRSAVAFGNGQFELGVIVEPTTSPGDIGAFKESIWPAIVEAGKQMDSHAQLSSTASIVVLDHDQTLPRSDKGAILRKTVYEKFEPEISAAYEAMQNILVDTPGLTLDADELEAGLLDIIRTEFHSVVAAGDLGVDDDLFELGMDSLQAVRLRRAIQRSLGDGTNLLSRGQITKDFIHQHPTVTRLAEALHGSRSRGVPDDNMIDQYVFRYRLPESSKRQVILLTGSTGSLGSYLLAHLVTLPDVARVICLRRQSGPAVIHTVSDELIADQLQKAESKGAVIPPEYRSKVEVLQADPYKHQLGLEHAAYLDVSNSITHIIHAAWPMDFQRTLASFKSQFQFLHNLLALARDAHAVQRPLKPRLLFVSSIAVVGQFFHAHGSHIVPEKFMDDTKSTNDFGYGKAKLVCERVLEDAAERFVDEIEVACVRVGQLSGAQGSSFWNTKEHFPALVKLSQKIGVLPRLEGTVSWLPVDQAAKAMSEILLSANPLRPVYHVENPVRQDWQPIMATIAHEMGLAPSAFVAFPEWAEDAGKVESDGPGTEETQLLIDFLKQDFRHMSSGGVILDSFWSRQVSPTLRDSAIVGSGLVAQYLHNWKRIGYLN